MKDVKISLPDDVKTIIDTLTANGYEAFAVGGCVRDSIIGRIPGDWDITTSADPYEVKPLFRRTIDTGIKHGTVTIMIGKEGYEVTTYRIDGEYEDSRHPKSVTFTKNLTEDLKRRDFTINAMAYSDQTGIIDEFGGLFDIRRRMIRAVGCAEDRFTEDALRILRAIRFSAQLNYSIEKDTKEAIRKLAPTLSKISAERIYTEITKMILSNHPERLMDADELGVLSVVLPEFSGLLPEDKLKTVSILNNAVVLGTEGFSRREITALRYACVCLLFGGKEKTANAVMKRLKSDNETISLVTRLVKFYDRNFETDDASVRHAITECGEDVMALLLCLKRLAQIAPEETEKMTEAYSEIIRRGDCIRLKDMAVTGNDLMNIGYKPGKELGEALKSLFLLVLDDAAKNDRETLLKMAEGML